MAAQFENTRFGGGSIPGGGTYSYEDALAAWGAQQAAAPAPAPRSTPSAPTSPPNVPQAPRPTAAPSSSSLSYQPPPKAPTNTFAPAPFSGQLGGGGGAAAAPPAATVGGVKTGDPFTGSAMAGLGLAIGQSGPTPGWADDRALAQTAGELGNRVGSNAMRGLSSVLGSRGRMY